MATVAALFDSQLEADRAMSAVAAAGYEQIEMRAFEDVDSDLAEPEVGSVLHLASDRLSAALDPNVGRWFDDLDDEALSDFFLAGVERGGVLVVALPEEEEAAQEIQAIFEVQGGRTRAEE